MTTHSNILFRPYKPKRLKGKRAAKLASKSSSSSTSDEDSPDSVSPIPRVRSIEALEFLSQAKQQRMASMMMMHQQQQKSSKHGKNLAQNSNQFNSNIQSLKNCNPPQLRQVNFSLFSISTNREKKIFLFIIHLDQNVNHNLFDTIKDATTTTSTSIVPITRLSSTNTSYPSSTHASSAPSSSTDVAPKSTSNAINSTPDT